MPGHLDFVTGLPISGLYYKESGHPDYVTSVPKCAVQMKLLPGTCVQTANPICRVIFSLRHVVVNGKTEKHAHESPHDYSEHILLRRNTRFMSKIVDD